MTSSIPPRQWLPGWIRWPIRVILLPFVLLDLGAQWAARQIVRPPFRQKGSCKQCGKCCQEILIPAPTSVMNKLYYIWSTQVNGFYLKDNSYVEDKGKKWLIMGCRYLRSNNRCAHYSLRPTICRQWPKIKHFDRPQICKGCGFKAEIKK